ncbi:hypothetical protein [Chromobacterium haemolyticum]|uniref:hypothetical protein n=1 Tax=Chromobacterium haemolyticum TaxID=394935 RepID=UPI00244B2DAB|nr:hypothetical protein [Chromobacterium haemolyticum]MDH0342103.1 hypothetical protein [Chromobacterium haemolyticum]
MASKIVQAEISRLKAELVRLRHETARVTATLKTLAGKRAVRVQVCKHYDASDGALRVNSSALATLSSAQLADLLQPTLAGKISAIYVLFDTDGGIEYIGQSTNVFARLGHHASNKSMWFTKVGILAVPREQLNEVEGALIRAHNPPMNRTAPAEVTDDWREAERLPTPEPGASKATAKRWPRTMAKRYGRMG